MARQTMERTAPDVHPMKYIPYRAGQKTREFKKAYMGKMLQMNLIDAAQPG